MLNFVRRLMVPDPAETRAVYVRAWLRGLPAGKRLLDVGCGPQIFRPDCAHLEYRAQDFGGYSGEGGDGALHDGARWHYGALDYTGNCWEIEEKAGSFDAVLCTEVLEHVPRPRETIVEAGRLMKPGAVALFTAPLMAIPHQTPYFFFAGFSKEFYEDAAAEAGLEVTRFEAYSGATAFVLLEAMRLGSSLPLPLRLVFSVWLLPLALLRVAGWRGPQYPGFGALVELRKPTKG